MPKGSRPEPVLRRRPKMKHAAGWRKQDLRISHGGTKAQSFGLSTNCLPQFLAQFWCWANVFARGIFILSFFLTVLQIYCQDYPPISAYLNGRGDKAVSERYALWAKDAVEKGHWKEALAALERASDFADVSSDICYLLALARSHEKKGRETVLDALNQALYVDSWNIYESEAARLLLAEQLISLRAYQDALDELSRVRSSPQEALLSLRALAAFRHDEFRRRLTDTLDRYPRECGPVRVFFSFLSNENAAGRNAGRDDLELLELVIRRLPVLLLRDPELAWMAAPFMRDIDEAKRLVSAYRAVNKPAAASLPAALHLGVIDEESALEELFAGDEDSRQALNINLALLDAIWGLLRREELRSLFRRNLSAYTGVLTEDADRDGIPETTTEYREGVLAFYTYDANQNGIPDMTVYFEAGNPRRARVVFPPESSHGLPGKEANIQWERYPAVLETELDGVCFIPRPLDFHYSPVKFTELMQSGLLFPIWDPLSPSLTRRVLVGRALRVERPSLEFSGGREVVELNQGIPVRAREYMGDMMVSETEFIRGRPQLQRVDMDLDGRMETVRHFRRNYRPVELEELWDYDRDIDYTVEIEAGSRE